MNKSECIEVISAGMATAIQDIGRFGFRNMGVPVGGVMDRQSAIFVNQILGNDLHTPVIELTLIGPVLLFHCDAIICISGAEGEIWLNDKLVILHTPILIRSAQTLRFGKFLKGVRSYIGVKGGLQVEKILGSASVLHHTHLQHFKKGNKIYLNKPHKQDADFINHKEDSYSAIRPLHIDINKMINVYPGPEWDLLTETSQKQVATQTYTITNQANSMGYRLSGNLLSIKGENEMLSSAVMPGTVQLLPDGQLVILMRSCQTTGGYPRILQVDEQSINQLAQRQPGDKVNFVISFPQY